MLLPALLDLVKMVGGSLGEELAVGSPYRSGDPELDAAWEASLLEALRDDALVLESMLRESDDGNGQLVIPEEQAEGVLRAASAVRLRIQQTLLKGVDERGLERGEVDLQSLTPVQQKGYMGYVFLANLQEILVRYVDPQASDSAWELAQYDENAAEEDRDEEDDNEPEEPRG
jgi:hypothetical protein